MNKKHILIIAIITGVILAIPLIAMQFSPEWDWDLFDFIVMGTLIFGMGLIFEFFASRAKTTGQKIIIGIVVFLALVLIWAQLAVGIFWEKLG